MTTGHSIDPRQQKILELMREFMESADLKGFMILGYKDDLEFKTVKVGNPELFLDMVKALAFHLHDTLEHVVTLPPPKDESGPPR